MYIVLGLIMLLSGFADAIMIFFVAMPVVTGLMNFVVPLQSGARDVAFPFLNNFSFWMTTCGAGLVMMSLFVGEFARTGWRAYPPLSGLAASPDVGVDYYIWSLQIAGVGTLLSGINLIATIVKMRAPGMTLMKMPVFTWTALCTNVLIVAAFPVLTAVLVLLSLDRYIGTSFFTNDLGGNAMMYVNLIWIWGHPEVYILILPAFGVFSEVVSTFCGKRLFGYASMVYATVVITILSYLVWLHHFFTMGSGASVNSFFGITTMIISIPTGAKIFNWLFTMYRGRIKFELPMLWTVAFMSAFVIGGMTGVLLAVPPADFVLHNSLFLIAHFHNVIIGGVLFGLFAGVTFWFPKAFGFKLDEFWGKMAFWFWVVGFYFAFMPLYALGLMGMTRRMQHYDRPEWYPWTLVAMAGALLILCGIILQVIQLFVSIRTRNQRREPTGDPWDGRTLEWATPSPPPVFNFAVYFDVSGADPYWGMKQKARESMTLGDEPTYTAIEIPRNTPTGFIAAFFATATGFALIWHIWWLVIVGLIGAYATFVVFAWRDESETEIPADEVARIDRANRQARGLALPGAPA